MKNLETIVESKEIVNVVDNHYHGQTIATELHYIKDVKGEVIDIVGIDRTNNIIAVDMRNNEILFDNTTTYGMLKDDKLYGWRFDRDGYTIDGFESSGYYKERE